MVVAADLDLHVIQTSLDPGGAHISLHILYRPNMSQDAVMIPKGQDMRVTILTP